MTDPLADEGWRAPAAPGPRRTGVALLLAGGALALVAWGVLATGWWAARGDEPRRVRVELDERGRVTVGDRTAQLREHERGGVRLLAAKVVAGPSDEPPRIVLDTATGVDADAVSVRVLRPLDGSPVQLLVVVPRSALPAVAAGAGPRSAPSLQRLTDPFDERALEARAERRRLERLQDRWWWIAPIVLLGAVATPLLAWRRARRRFLSMRRPGPGADVGVDPPSSLDPIGAALLVAGTGQVDVGAAFAGHVLDLVERRQLPMRRSTSTPPGLGTLLGLHHAGELDDVAAPLLGALAGDDAAVFLPDSAAAPQARFDAPERAAWREHVAARAAFEQVVVPAPVGRLRTVLAAASLLALAAAAWAWIAGPGGTRAWALLALVAAGSLAAALGAWLRDAMRWRVVARGRRTERAQWLAWRAAAAGGDGPASDLRNVPVLVAIGAPDAALRSHAPADAVDLAAVTARTAQALRGIAP